MVSFGEWLGIVRETDAAYANAMARGDHAAAQAAVARRDAGAAAHQAEIQRVQNSAPPNFAPNFTPPFFPAAGPPPPPPKPPDPWMTTETYTAPPGVKQADPDIILFQDRPISPEFLIELLYEDIAGTELINISRSDIIDGQEVVYSPVKQLSSLRRRYNPNNIIGLPELSSSFFSRFQIELLFRGVNPPYFDEQGNLVIEINDVKDDEIIEIEIDTNGTIDEVDFS